MRYRGLVFLVLWQTAPVVVQQDSTGRTSIAFAVGGGQYEQISTDCEGGTIESRQVEARAPGLLVQHHASDHVRLAAAAGAVESDEPLEETTYDGGYIGGLIGLDWEYVGVGGGPIMIGGEALPTLYVRILPAEGVHLFADVMAPGPPLGLAGDARIGLGYGQGRVRGIRALAGIAGCHAACESNGTGAFVELAIPTGDRFDLELRGYAAPGEEHANRGFAIGGRYHFGAGD